jgi:hypothetical protein
MTSLPERTRPAPSTELDLLRDMATKLFVAVLPSRWGRLPIGGLRRKLQDIWMARHHTDG